MSDEVVFCFNVIPYAEMYGTHPRFVVATSRGFSHTSDHCDPYTSKSGSVMQARCAKAYSCRDHVAAQKYRQSMLDNVNCISKSTKHTIAHKLGGDNSLTTHVPNDSLISNVATVDKDNNESDDDTTVDNLHTHVHSRLLPGWRPQH